MTQWAWWHSSTGPDEYRIRELLRAIWDLHSMYGADKPWLWRGQANAGFLLEPGVHTRVRRQTGLNHAKRARRLSGLNDDKVKEFTAALISAARSACLDMHEGTRLPDMALMALLQHHGAATPLLDVSLDPMVGLYMAVVGLSAADDRKDGALFAIQRPRKSIAAFDSRAFETIYDGLPNSGVMLYSAPDVSERLRIQRGHFLLGRVSKVDARVTIPLSLDPAKLIRDSWIAKRLEKRGRPGVPQAATSSVAVFRITAKFKKRIQSWLEERSGLTRDFVYPTPWHQPHMDRFAVSHGRKARF
jgi:hypothetical protein